MNELQTIALLVLFASSAYAVELTAQQQIDSLRAALADKSAQLADKSAQLADKSAQLADKSAQVTQLTEQLKAEYVQANAAGIFSDADIAVVGSTRRRRSSSSSSSSSTRRRRRSSSSSSSSTFQTLAPNQRYPSGSCSDHCDGKCWIPINDPLDKTCKVTDPNMELFESLVVSVGTKDHPKWTINAGRPPKSMGEVECPCVGSHGKALTEREATARILGEAAAIGIPDGICKAVLGLRRDGFKKHHGVAWNARIALATIKMVKCWKASCAGNTDQYSLDELLETNNEATSGWDCG